MDHPDLEVSLYRQDTGVYTIDLRLADPTSEADRRLNSNTSIRFDDDALRKASQDPAAYGALLGGTLLAEETVRTFFGEALAAAAANDAPLAVRLAINPNAAELHSLRWETLHLPDSDAPLLTGENLRFSRYLSSLDWRPVRLRPQADLRALVAVASPSNAAKWQLAEVKTERRAGCGPRRPGRHSRH